MQTRYQLSTLNEGNLAISDYFSIPNHLLILSPPLVNKLVIQKLFHISLLAFLLIMTPLSPLSIPDDELFDNLFTHKSRVIKQASSPLDMGHRIANFAARPPLSGS